MNREQNEGEIAEACKRLIECREVIGSRNIDISRRYPGTTIYRLFHEAAGDSGGRVMLDRYGSLLLAVITGFSQRPPAADDDPELDSTISSLFAALKEMSGFSDISGLLFQYRTPAGAGIAGKAGTVPRRLIGMEDGLSFILMPLRGQNCGIFTESAHARRFIRGHARGRRVLNLFAYTCGFSVAALAGGAEEVVNVDMKSAFLDWGRENHRENSLDLRRVRFSKLNVMKSFGKFERFGPYDIVICDPPPFQGNSYNPQRDFRKLIRRSASLVAPGGLLMIILNSFRSDRSLIHSSMESEGLLDPHKEALSPFASVITPEASNSGSPGTHISVYKRGAALEYHPS